MSLEQEIIDKLTLALTPTHLQVFNESHNHNVPVNSETHFKVIITSDVFEGKRLLARHRLVNEALSDAFNKGLHALSMHTFSPHEWDDAMKVPDSPDCKG
ncbi:BolA family protein [Shewanella surugensis]|uniref:BolA family transcriptional regulator n=1 Tax=Shewanella surugensis TaxID=212020 RepID=A0ABT0LH84_9GAMM|nr:BolA family protein [Shewanella surugensis]MCL1127061.1 BolA family transcriptional regulator [Shewanella surugensis]